MYFKTSINTWRYVQLLTFKIQLCLILWVTINNAILNKSNYENKKRLFSKWQIINRYTHMNSHTASFSQPIFPSIEQKSVKIPISVYNNIPALAVRNFPNKTFWAFAHLAEQAQLSIGCHCNFRILFTFFKHLSQLGLNNFNCNISEFCSRVYTKYSNL